MTMQEIADKIAISIHALREEGDLRHSHRSSKPECISIHALREEGDLRWIMHSSLAIDFYPRPPRGGRQPQHLQALGYDAISIHALREEGDR